MNKKGRALIIGIIGIIAIIILFVTRGGEAPSAITGDAVPVGKIKVAHVFMDGMHTFTGEINLPTPCHTLQHKIIIAESHPEQVTAVFETKSEVDACVQMATPEPFVVSFEASEEANFRITLNNKNVLFEVIEAQGVIEKTEEDATTTIEELNEEAELADTEGSGVAREENEARSEDSME